MSIKDSLTKMLRVVFFRGNQETLVGLNRNDLYVGLFATWIVGMGRYWDDPKAHILQHLGTGSVAYIFVMAALLWIVVKPLKVPGWNYINVVTFVSLTSLPAIFYAIPVERFFDLQTSAVINAYFLMVVAAWRVALWIHFLIKRAQLSLIGSLLCTFLPLTLIVNGLAVLNLERAVFNIMGGIREHTSNDSAYAIVYTLSLIAVVMFIPLLLAYLLYCYQRRKRIA